MRGMDRHTHKAQPGCTISFGELFLQPLCGRKFMANTLEPLEGRERLLRQFLRHERLSVAVALAEFSHHTAPRGQNMARAGEEDHEMNLEPRLLDPPLPQQAATVGYVAARPPLSGAVPGRRRRH